MTAKRHRHSMVRCEVVEVTPEIAEAWLERNTGNFRTVDKFRVRNYANEMRTGNWDMNGETIKFSIDKELLDGQHRLLGVILSATAVFMLVVEGINSNAFHIDRGKPRSVAQWLRHKKTKNANAVAAIGRLAIVHNKGLWTRMGVGVDGVTDSEILTFVETYEERLQAAYLGPRVQGMSNAVLSAILFLGSEDYNVRQNDYAQWFREALATGKGLNEDGVDAAFHFRKRLLQQRGTRRLTPFLTRMLCTLAWNKTVWGSECTSASLRLRLVGPKATPLPNKVLQNIYHIPEKATPMDLMLEALCSGSGLTGCDISPETNE